MVQLDFHGEESVPRWAIFHDESLCEQENFIYHGFLLVSHAEGRSIVETLRQPEPELPDNYDKRIHFTDLGGLQGRARAAVRWVELARDRWLPSGSLRFYCLGVNLNNINYDLYRSSGAYARDLPRKNDWVYRRFYEIGLNAALAWFQVDPTDVTHVFYDQGKLDIDRFNRTLTVCGPDTRIKPLANDCLVSGIDLSKCLQLTDVLLGTIRKTYAPLARRAPAQIACVDRLYEVVEHFSHSKTSYNPKSRFWKKFCLSFFPKRGDMTPEEFFARGLDYHRKAGDLFYCDRKTFRQREAEKKQGSLFEI